MKIKHPTLIAALVLAFSLMGCGDRKADAGSSNASNSSAASEAPTTDKWIGQWNGPEGTFLKLAGGKGQYEITIQNLDGPRTFQGSSVDGQVQFERNGVKESIRATNGAETGMKWLDGKANCLTVRLGEGYCRD